MRITMALLLALLCFHHFSRGKIDNMNECMLNQLCYCRRKPNVSFTIAVYISKLIFSLILKHFCDEKHLKQTFIPHFHFNLLQCFNMFKFMPQEIRLAFAFIILISTASAKLEQLLSK